MSLKFWHSFEHLIFKVLSLHPLSAKRLEFLIHMTVRAGVDYVDSTMSTAALIIFFKRVTFAWAPIHNSLPV